MAGYRGSPRCNYLIECIENIRRQVKEAGRGHEIDPWTDEAQERFLKKHNCTSWHTAPDDVIEKAIAKITEAARMFGYYVEDDDERDLREVHSGDQP